MSTTCSNCGHEFHNVMLRTRCPKCGAYLGKKMEDEHADVMNPTLPGDILNPMNPAHQFSQAAVIESDVSAPPVQSIPEPTPSPSPEPSYSSGSEGTSGSSSGAE